MEACLSPGGLGAIKAIEPKPLKYRYKTQPFAHQKKALNRIIKLKGRCLLAMEMGTGKTKVAIDWASICYRNYELRRVLVVAPVSVLPVWRVQIRQHSPIRARVAVLSGSTNDKARLIRGMMKYPFGDKGIEWIIINYESIWREDSRGKRLEDYLRKWGPDLVIADESHKIKHSTSRQSRSLSRMGDSAPMALALSGTPITKSPLDVFGQFRFLNSAVFGTRWTDFKMEYGVWGGLSGFQLRGVKNLPKLKRKVRQNSYQVRKEECLDLPPKLGDIADPNGPNIVPVELPDRIMSFYRDMASKMIVEIENDEKVTASIVLTKLLRLSQITSGHITNTEGITRIIHDYKLNAGMDLIEDVVEQGESIVVFTRFRSDYHRLAEQLAKRKLGYAVLSGEVPAGQRESLVQRFQDRKFPVFVSQIASGSLGIDLTAAAQTLFYSWDYRWDHYVQAADRTHRQGQARSCTYYHLVAPHTIDQLSLRVLMQKGNLAKYIIHDPHVLDASLTKETRLS